MKLKPQTSSYRFNFKPISHETKREQTLQAQDRSCHQFSSVTQLCLTFCDPMDCSTSGFPVHHQLPDLAQTHVHRVVDAIQPFHPSSVVPFSCLQSFPATGSFLISSSSENSGLISFRMDWFDLLAVQGTLKSLLQYHSSKASILQCSAFFMVQLSYSYMTTGKTIALTRWTFVSKVISLLFNMLSRFVIAFLPRRKCHGAVTICSDLEAQENKACHCFHCFPIYLP